MIDDVIVRNEIIAIIILVAGIVVARLASAAVGALLGAVDRVAARQATTEKPLISPKQVRVIRTLAFWLIVVLAISYALTVLGVGTLQTMLVGVMDFVPQLLVGLTIVVSGHVIGLLVSHLVSNSGAEVSSNPLLPRLLYSVILTVSIVMGLQHVRVDISFVTRLLLIAFAVAGSGLMLAFALGARQYVANLLARRELARLGINDRIQIDGIEGEIVEIHSTGVNIATAAGVAHVPAARFAETTYSKLHDDVGDE
jgi:hypothetical protein